MKYRAEVDGLRALAVLPVILFHAGFSLFAGGFVGVDIFFVISGFLITTILIEDIEQGRFSIAHFYERRARRILPALTVVILFCIPLSWAIMQPPELASFGKSVIAASLFVSNILFWREADYFETAAEEKPLLHTWSLAVEEQYYVFFPIFLFLTWRFGRERVFWLIAIAAACSLVLSQYLASARQSANFYLAPSRVWELFAGSMAAFVALKHGVRGNGALAGLGLAMVASSVFLFDKSTPFPSLYALLPIIGVVLLLLFANQQTWVGRALANPVLVGVGLISYSAYLWHQPLFAFARHVSIEEPSVALYLVLSMISLGLAWASWKYIEAPFRNRAFMTMRQVLTVSVVVIVTTAALGAVLLYQPIRASAGQLNALNAPIRIADYSHDNEELQRRSWDWLKQRTGAPRYTVDDNPADRTQWFDEEDPRPRLLVVGNSHSKDLYNVLVSSEHVSEQYQIARFGIQLDEIVLSSDFLDSPNYRLADMIVLATRFSRTDIDQLERVVTRLQQDDKLVVLIENIFEFSEYRSGRWTLADKIVFEQRDSGLTAGEIAAIVKETYYAEYKRGEAGLVKAANAQIARIASQNDRLIVLSRMDYACVEEEQFCLAIDEDLTKYFYDYGHQTLEGSAAFGARVDALGWFPGAEVLTAAADAP